MSSISGRFQLLNPDRIFTGIVFKRYCSVITIREHIAAEEALTGGGEAVGVDEAADLWVVITALQVIESRLFGVIFWKQSAHFYHAKRN